MSLYRTSSIFRALPTSSLDGRTLTLSIAGSPDALIKAAAKHEIVRLVTHEASLDDIFLTFYSEDGEGGDAP